MTIGAFAEEHAPSTPIATAAITTHARRSLIPAKDAHALPPVRVAAVTAVDAVDLLRARLLGEVVVDRPLDAFPVGVVDDHERGRGEVRLDQAHAVQLL